eukprot:CAMPEP_0196720744 /NCGR_PEP_ID=MMETSP1091-20130531/3457_1 /TAXON_ID=302021 /ORGANISM="Rhodomonas sp., Strain CCMP768" /LENGTH=274 /DNA_ID=CAMNT_0042062059 /DNA_START=22 /DNA_END=846 /DNA_ORIENTATION=+
MLDLPLFDIGHSNALAFENTSSFDSAGNEYTGNNGYTVVDSYSCGSGACGGFSMGSFPAGYVAAQPVDAAGASSLASTYTDTAGNVYTGFNGYTVTDSYTCGSGACGGFSMGSFPAGTETAVADPSGGSLAQVPTTTLAVDAACAPDTGGVDGTCFSVTDPYHEGEGYTVWTNVYDGKVEALAPIVNTTPELAEAKSGSETKTCRSNPAHYLLCGHAMLLGALSATQTVGSKWIDGKPVSAQDWHKEFTKTSEEAVTSVSPVGGYIMSTQILSK